MNPLIMIPARMAATRLPNKPLADIGGTVMIVRAYQQAEASGLSPKSGCRMGICQSCRCRKIEGVTRDVRTGELSTDTDVDIQLCVSIPVGNVSIDL